MNPTGNVRLFVEAAEDGAEFARWWIRNGVEAGATRLAKPRFRRGRADLRGHGGRLGDAVTAFVDGDAASVALDDFVIVVGRDAQTTTADFFRRRFFRVLRLFRLFREFDEFFGRKFLLELGEFVFGGVFIIVRRVGRRRVGIVFVFVRVGVVVVLIADAKF